MVVHHIKGDGETSRGRSSKRHLFVGCMGNGGDATGSCVDEGTLTQAAAPYIPLALEYSKKDQSAMTLRKLLLIHQQMNQPLTQLNRAPLATPLYVTKFTYSLSFICHVSYTERRTTRALYRIRKERSKDSTIPL